MLIYNVLKHKKISKYIDQNFYSNYIHRVIRVHQNVSSANISLKIIHIHTRTRIQICTLCSHVEYYLSTSSNSFHVSASNLSDPERSFMTMQGLKSASYYFFLLWKAARARLHGYTHSHPASSHRHVSHIRPLVTS